MANYNGASYLVWVDVNFRPWVTKIVNGTGVSSPLDPNSDYKAQPDGHHRYSIGVDTDGYLHVTGGMHYYSLSTTIVSQQQESSIPIRNAIKNKELFR